MCKEIISSWHKPELDLAKFRSRDYIIVKFLTRRRTGRVVLLPCFVTLVVGMDQLHEIWGAARIGNWHHMFLRPDLLSTSSTLLVVRSNGVQLERSAFNVADCKYSASRYLGYGLIHDITCTYHE